MKVSILIPLYNKEKYIEDTIFSAINQTWINKEIIIVDDGSTDNSFSIAKKYESDIVKVFRKHNGGAASCRNYAFNKCSGDYIQYLDADDLLDENKIEFQIKLLADHKFNNDIFAFCGWLEFDDGAMYDFSKRKDFLCSKNFTPAYESIIQCWKVSFPLIPIHTYLIPRALILKTGNWIESLKTHEDCEYFARLINNSKSLLFCKNTMVYYRNVAESLSKSNTFEKVQSEFRVIDAISSIILNNRLTPETIDVCSLHYSEFIEARYPLNRLLLKSVFQQMKTKKLYFKVAHRGLFYRISYKLFGWRLTRLLMIPYNRIKIVINLVICVR